MSWFWPSQENSIFHLRQKSFVNLQIIYLTGVNQIASIQVYILDSLQSTMDTSFLDGRILDAQDILLLTATADWTASYDQPNRTVQITLTGIQSGVVIYRSISD